MEEITHELIGAAREGEVALLDRIDALDTRYLKVIIASLSLRLSVPTRQFVL